MAHHDVTLKVGDVNDNPPVFALATYQAEVRESAGVGASVLEVSASDQDVGENARITYSLTPSKFDDWFEIDSETGLITSLAGLDCEVSSRPELTVVGKAYTHNHRGRKLRD